jgi:hypothetical protein
MELGGDPESESIRALKRRLSDVVYRALLAAAVRNSTIDSAEPGRP